MKIPPKPHDEAERIKALKDLEILDTDLEEVYDGLIKLASIVCQTPISLFSLIDSERQWFKSKVGIDVSSTERSLSFCGHAILGDEPFEINDARSDERFHDNPLVAGEPNVVFYAGIPIKTKVGFKIGTLCVIDKIPRKLTVEQRDMLVLIARQIEIHLDMRTHLTSLARVFEIDESLKNGETSQLLINRNILLFEDNFVDQLILKGMLGSLGLNVNMQPTLQIRTSSISEKPEFVFYSTSKNSNLLIESTLKTLRSLKIMTFHCSY